MVKKICPVCGRETDMLIEGMCPDCYRLSHRLLETPERIDVLACRGCGAYYIGGRWVRGVGALVKLVNSKIKTHGLVESMDIKVFRDKAKIKVRGKAHELIPSTYDEEYVVKISYKWDLCPTCRAEVLERDEAVIQVRPIGGDANSVKRTVMDIVRRIISKGEERGRVIKIEDFSYGFDIKVTNQRLARSIAIAIHEELPSSFTETGEVMGYKDGRKVERRVISIHVVSVKKGEVVNIDGVYYIVKGIFKDHMDLINLADGSRRVVRFSKLSQLNIRFPHKYTLSCKGTVLEVNVDGIPYSISGIEVLCP